MVLTCTDVCRGVSKRAQEYVLCIQKWPETRWNTADFGPFSYGSVL